jgi:hypothetical protein
LHDLHAGVICDFSEDDVFAIEPGSDDRSDEELGAVTRKRHLSIPRFSKQIGRVMGKLKIRSCNVMRGDRSGRGDTTYVFGPAFAMESKPGLECFSLKFSSANFSP